MSPDPQPVNVAGLGLRYATARAPTVDLGRFPDFFLLGPQRTGTTWLTQHLRTHPEIFFADPREVYFFSYAQWPKRKPPHRPDVSNELTWYLSQFVDTPASTAARRSGSGAATCASRQWMRRWIARVRSRSRRACGARSRASS